MLNKFYAFVIIAIITISCNSTEYKSINSVNQESENIENLQITESDITDTLDISDRIINRIDSLESIPGMRVLKGEFSRNDTTLHDYLISYIKKDNNDLIAASYDSVYFVGREIILNIKYKGKEIFDRMIDRNFFKSFIPMDEISKYSICSLIILSIDSLQNIVFWVNICIPDTDVCYDFELSISNDGSLNINEHFDENEGEF